MAMMWARHGQFCAAIFAGCGMMSLCSWTAQARQEKPVPAPTRLRAAFVVCDPAAVAPLHPFGENASSSTRRSPETERRYGFDQKSGAIYRVDSRHANQDYRAARPFGEISIEAYQPDRISKSRIEAVQQCRRYWPNPDSFQKETIIKGWRWEAPKTFWRTAFDYWSDIAYGDRFGALCLQPATGDPVLLLFDAASGPRWQVTIPLRDALQRYTAATGASTSDVRFGDHLGAFIFPHVTRDGSRTLVSFAGQSPQCTLLFVYDARGTLRKTVAFSGGLCLQIRRAPSADRFVLDIALQAGAKSYLVDGDGNVLGRFVDDAGRPVQIDRLSNTHAATVSATHGASIYRSLYELPNK